MYTEFNAILKGSSKREKDRIYFAMEMEQCEENRARKNASDELGFLGHWMICFELLRSMF
jgi:predicted metal-dependent HD superfamily phosphohydrolase